MQMKPIAVQRLRVGVESGAAEFRLVSRVYNFRARSAPAVSSARIKRDKLGGDKERSPQMVLFIRSKATGAAGTSDKPP